MNLREVERELAEHRARMPKPTAVVLYVPASEAGPRLRALIEQRRWSVAPREQVSDPLTRRRPPVRIGQAVAQRMLF